MYPELDLGAPEARAVDVGRGGAPEGDRAGEERPPHVRIVTASRRALHAIDVAAIPVTSIEREFAA